MKENQSSYRGVLYVISCASPTAELIPNFIQEAKEVGWEICVIATPHGTRFLDISSVQELTGHPVRSEYKHPADPDILPRADAIVVFPATFNTLNKWALGITDTLALGILCEYTGLNMPIVAIPGILTASGLDTHPAFPKSMETLRSYGITILYRPDIYPPKNQVPASVILGELHTVVEQKTKARSM